MPTDQSYRTPAEVRRLFETTGVSLSEWARLNRFSTGLVYQVVAGKRKCLRGQSHRVAVLLGMKEGLVLDAVLLTDFLQTLAGKEISENQTRLEENAIS